MHVKALFLSCIALLSVGVVGLSFGQSSDIGCPSCVTIPQERLDLYKELFPLIIWTDDTIYDHDSVIMLSGHLRPENNLHPVTIKVTNPIGNVVLIQQITASDDGSFSLNIDTKSPLWARDGVYIIQAQSGPNTRIFKTQVELVPFIKGEKSECMVNEIKAVATNGGIYCIPYVVQDGHTTGVDGKLNIAKKSLSVDIRGTNISSIIIKIPRHILDSKTPDGADTSFMVLSKGTPANYEELDPTDTHRTLKLHYPPDRRANFEIVGSHVIPEFGLLTVVVLGASLTSIILLSKGIFGRSIGYLK